MRETLGGLLDAFADEWVTSVEPCDSDAYLVEGYLGGTEPGRQHLHHRDALRHRPRHRADVIPARSEGKQPSSETRP